MEDCTCVSDEMYCSQADPLARDFEMTPRNVSEVQITHHLLFGHQEEETQRAYPMSVTWASHMADTVLMGR